MVGIRLITTNFMNAHDKRNKVVVKIFQFRVHTQKMLKTYRSNMRAGES